MRHLPKDSITNERIFLGRFDDSRMTSARAHSKPFKFSKIRSITVLRGGISVTINSKPAIVRRSETASRRGAQVRPIGVIRSVLKTRTNAPKQGSEGGPDAWLEVYSFAETGLKGLEVGDQVIVVTWLHRARRDVLAVHPRSDRR